MRGRKPLSNRMKLLKGSKKPLNPDEPIVPPPSTEAPAELDAAALAIWNEAIPDLIKAGVVSSVDVGRAGRACRWEAIGRDLLTQAEIVPLANRGELIRLAATAHTMADRVWTALGVGDPRERNRMRLAPQEENALETFKARHA